MSSHCALSENTVSNMSDTGQAWQNPASPPDARKRLRRRHAAERRFRFYGLAGIATALIVLTAMLISIGYKGSGAFVQTHLRIEVSFDPKLMFTEAEGRNSMTPGPETIALADYGAVLRPALVAQFGVPDIRENRRDLMQMLSSGAVDDLRDMVLAQPSLIGTRQELWLLASANIDMLNKGVTHRTGSAAERQVKDNQLAWFEQLESAGRVEKQFNSRFFTGGDSREPERAGILGSATGSLLALIVTVALALPVGVAASIYLEEFAPKNRWTDLIEVNVNNLAAVPSIVFGLLGLAVILGVFGVPRSAALAGGLVLALMTLPTIVIAARSALKAVPPSIREGALALGASKQQVVWHHVLPLAMPGILTGTIIGVARALGESAPLLMIGMVAFVVEVPSSFLSPATALPVQIFMWADSPERAFAERTSAAILVLLVVLAIFNALAVFLRRKFERRW
jgi:phosphate transport system permease protein